MTAKTARQMLPAIGATVQLRCDGLLIDCRVTDVKSSYGRNRLLIVPARGTGQRWVELSSVLLVETSETNLEVRR